MIFNIFYGKYVIETTLYLSFYQIGKNYYKQECPSIEGQPPLIWILLTAVPLTFISDVDLDMIMTYLHAKN